MSNKKYKRLTQSQKKDRKEIKKQLQEQGVLPPDKPRLNRKKFSKEVVDEWNGSHVDQFVLNLALSPFLNTGKINNITSEQLGVLKMMKCALLLSQFFDSLPKNKKVTYEDIYNIISPIIEL